MENTTHNRAIALAAIFQCVDGVSQIANTGNVDENIYKTAVKSILTDDAKNAEDIYGSVADLKLGMRSMMSQLGTSQVGPDGTPKDMEATRYALGLLQLEKKLSNNQGMFKQVLAGIEDIQKKLEHFDSDHENITASLADIYANTISNIDPKIMVKGEQTHLANPTNAAKIRTLLLAGIRAALLWRQAGGNRWKLLFERGKLQKQADRILAQIA